MLVKCSPLFTQRAKFVWKCMVTSAVCNKNETGVLSLYGLHSESLLLWQGDRIWCNFTGDGIRNQSVMWKITVYKILRDLLAVNHLVWKYLLSTEFTGAKSRKLWRSLSKTNWFRPKTCLNMVLIVQNRRQSENLIMPQDQIHQIQTASKTSIAQFTN